MARIFLNLFGKWLLCGDEAGARWGRVRLPAEIDGGNAPSRRGHRSASARQRHRHPSRDQEQAVPAVLSDQARRRGHGQRQRASDYGAADFVTKPVDFDFAEGALASAADRHTIGRCRNQPLTRPATPVRAPHRGASFMRDTRWCMGSFLSFRSVPLPPGGRCRRSLARRGGYERASR